MKSMVALPQPESSALNRQRGKMSVIRRNVSVMAIIMALSFTVDNMSQKVRLRAGQGGRPEFAGRPARLGVVATSFCSKARSSFALSARRVLYDLSSGNSAIMLQPFASSKTLRSDYRKNQGCRGRKVKTWTRARARAKRWGSDAKMINTFRKCLSPIL